MDDQPRIPPGHAHNNTSIFAVLNQPFALIGRVLTTIVLTLTTAGFIYSLLRGIGIFIRNLGYVTKRAIQEIIYFVYNLRILIIILIVLFSLIFAWLRLPHPAFAPRNTQPDEIVTVAKLAGLFIHNQTASRPSPAPTADNSKLASPSAASSSAMATLQLLGDNFKVYVYYIMPIFLLFMVLIVNRIGR